MNSPVVVLGAGPAGLGAAYQLSRRGTPAILLEQADDVGGHAGGFQLAGLHVDYGSHRLHPSTPPEVMADIKSLLGADLLDRPRHGRIRLMGRWLHFPLKPADLVLHAPPSFALGVIGDGLRKMVGGKPEAATEESFATILEAGLGRTICRQFYFPYAIKMWGRKAETLSPIQARKRVSAGSLGKMIGKILGAVPGLKKPGQGRFYYPRGGFGRIARAYRDAAIKAGADIRTGTRVTAIERDGLRVTGVRVARNGVEERIATSHVLSTIPVKALTSALNPAAPPEILAASDRIELRSLILVYLVLPVARFTEFDAHYFPEVEIPFTRLSEPKNYSVPTEPKDRTVLCAEMPCSTDDGVWSLSDEALAKLVADGLARSGIPLPATPIEIVVKRAKNAYPIYGTGYETAVDTVDGWLSGLEGLVFFGRQGLFAHDNTHHALRMAYAAVSCLGADGRFDRSEWARRREEFKAHVVED